MTLNGKLFPQPQLVRLIVGIVSSSSPTHSGNWPTPTTADVYTDNLKSSQQTDGSMHSVSLGQAVQMWPTPRSNTAMASLITPEIAHNPKRFPNLETVVGRRMWPTPTAHPENSNKNGKFANPTLGDAVKANPYPTMSANGMGNTGSRQMLDKKILDGSITEEEKKAMTAGNGGRLNPMWVEWLMGFPLGWTDLEDLETL
jgi:hypothetical protein